MTDQVEMETFSDDSLADAGGDFFWAQGLSGMAWEIMELDARTAHTVTVADLLALLVSHNNDK